MSDVVNYKCPCCGAMLPFSGATGQMTCNYCDASFSVEEVKAAMEAEAAENAPSDLTWESQEPSLIQDADGKVQGYLCPSCGAEMVADDKTAATECPYCGNFAIIPQSFEGMYRPELVVPFAVDKEKAVGALKEFTKGKKLLPKSFLENNRIETITGLYVPFWLYSCHASGSVSFDAVKEKRWEDANNQYVKKDHYRVVRSGEMDFERIPVDASTQMDDAIMDSLEPYDFGKATGYDAAYFSGYLASRYDQSQEQAQPRANERVKGTFRQKMREAVRDYREVKEQGESIRLTGGKASYAMLPVWMMSTKYQDQIYTFGINGQTGKMVGTLPVDRAKYVRSVLLGALIGGIVSLVAMYFILGGFEPMSLLVGAVIALIAGFGYGGALKGAMKNVAIRTNATGYLVDRSLKMGQNVDRFLFSKTDTRAKTPRQNS